MHLFFCTARLPNSIVQSFQQGLCRGGGKSWVGIRELFIEGFCREGTLGTRKFVGRQIDRCGGCTGSIEATAVAMKN